MPQVSWPCTRRPRRSPTTSRSPRASRTRSPRRAVRLRLSTPVTGIDRTVGGVAIASGTARHLVDRVVVCAGLQGDRVSNWIDGEDGPRIVPFRGEYMAVKAAKAGLVRGMVYPVPDPRYPFLGVHFTRRVSGGLEVGPNAVLALGREAYKRRSEMAMRDVRSMVTWPGFWRMARTHWRTGVREVRGSMSLRVYMREAQRYVPEIGAADVVRAGQRASVPRRSTGTEAWSTTSASPSPTACCASATRPHPPRRPAWRLPNTSRRSVAQALPSAPLVALGGRRGPSGRIRAAAAVARQPGPAGAAAGPRRARRHRPPGRGWRVHGTLDGAACGRAAAGPAGAAHRGGPDRRARDRAQRRLLRGEPDARRGQRPGAVARRVRRDARARDAQPRRDRADVGALRHRLRMGAGRAAHRGDARARGRGVGAGGRRLPRRGGRPAAGGLADVPRRPARRGRGGDGRPGPAGVGAGRRGRGAGGAHRRGHPPRVAEEGRRRGRGDHQRRSGAGEARGARDQRLPRAAAPQCLAGGAGLRLRAGDRAAHRAAARGTAVGPGHRGRGLGQPVPLLPAHPGPPDPVGRVRRGLPLRPLDRRRSTTTAPRPSRRWPGTSPRRSRSWRASGSRTAGRA